MSNLGYNYSRKRDNIRVHGKTNISCHFKGVMLVDGEELHEETALRCFRVMIKVNPKRQPQRPRDDTFRQPAISREIVIPVDLDTYSRVVENNEAFRSLLTECYSKNPEGFPPEFENGFRFQDHNADDGITADASAGAEEIKLRLDA